MKTTIYSLLVMSIQFTWNLSNAQNNVPIPFNAWVVSQKSGALQIYQHSDVSAIIQFKYEDGSIAYAETHTTTLDDKSNLNVLIGTGTPVPGYDFNEVDFARVKKYCLDVSLIIGGNIFTIPTIMRDFGAVPTANYAQQAGNSSAIGGKTYSGESINTEEFFENLQDLTLIAVRNSEDKVILVEPATFVKKNTGISSVTGNPLTYFNLGNGTDLPIVASNMSLAEIRSKYILCPAHIDDVSHVLEVKAPPVERGNLEHNTASIYAENILYDKGIGLFANASARGVYSQGVTGVLGITNGSGNGAALWAHVGSAPLPGGFKYGMFTTDNSVADAWAAAVFGSGFYTGTWSQSSDARLKREIRTQTNGLNTILQIRPTQYQYVEGTPYALPAGIHYGFIAQEMEKVLPELVSDIIMPKSIDPAALNNSEVETYKAINYTELIPILTAAMQELNAKVDEQGKEISRLNIALQACTKN